MISRKFVLSLLQGGDFSSEFHPDGAEDGDFIDSFYLSCREVIFRQNSSFVRVKGGDST